MSHTPSMTILKKSTLSNTLQKNREVLPMEGSASPLESIWGAPRHQGLRMEEINYTGEISKGMGVGLPLGSDRQAAGVFAAVWFLRSKEGTSMLE